MITLDDVRTICVGFPGTSEVVNRRRGGASWRTAAGQFVWERGPTGRDLEQLAEQSRTWPDGPVVGIRTDGLDAKAALIESYPETFFTIPHFDGWPAVLSPLTGADPALLRETITEAWLLRTTAALRRAWLAEHRGG